MNKINQNTLAKLVTEREGLKTSLSIAQVKEVIRCLKDEFKEGYSASQILEIFGK